MGTFGLGTINPFQQQQTPWGYGGLNVTPFGLPFAQQQLFGQTNPFATQQLYGLLG